MGAHSLNGISLYHFWSSTASQRIRMALHCKNISYQDFPVSYWDDETFFELGLARNVPVLKIGADTLYTDSLETLWRIDSIFPNSPALVEGVIDEAAWRAVLDWRNSVDTILERLLTPALLSYKDIAEDENSIVQYKQSVQKKYGLSAEALANDRYASYEQLVKLSRLAELAKHLAEKRFYMGKLSIADILIVADLYPLQCLDGISLPIDFLYYLQRVESACNIDLQEGMLIKL